MIFKAWLRLCIVVTVGLFFCEASVAQGLAKHSLINSGLLLEEGSKKFDKKDYTGAIEQYVQIPKSDTNYSTALYEISYTYYSDSQYTKALAAANDGLRLFPEKKGRFLLLKANVVDDMDQKEEAIQLYTQCLQLNRYEYTVYYNRAVTYGKLDKNDSAMADLQSCLRINPFYASAHYLLALHYLERGNMVASALAFQTYLLIAPEGRYLKNSIQWLDNISKASDDVMKYAEKATDEELGSFAPIQAVLLSKAALDKSYKLKTSLEDNIVRQLQAVNEQLQYDAGNNEFAQQVYVPFYRAVMDKNYFEPHVYTIFSGLTIEAIGNWRKKNNKTLDPFIAFAQDYLNVLRITQELNASARASSTNCFLFEDGYVKGKGQCKDNDASKYYGMWELYYNNGQLKEKGLIDEQQQRQGEWITYHENGMRKEVSVYKDNALNGPSNGWHENGNKWFEYTMQMGKIDGKATSYFYNGLPRLVQHFKNEIQEGEEKEYTYQGELYAEANYIAGKKNGMVKWYHPNGKTREQLNYTNGLEDGQYQSYYSNGAVFEKGLYVAGKKEGLWTSLHENGKLKDSTTYAENEVTGPFSEYFDNGNIGRRGNYSKKKMDGLLYDYAKDGKLYCITKYDKGRLREITYYNKEGATISNTNTRGDNNLIITYSSDGYKLTEGYYNKEGYRNGSFTTFYPNGNIREQSTYTNGELNGASIEKMFTGQPWKEQQFSNGKEDGFFRNYFTSGKISSEGWMVEDSKEQLLRFYNLNGSLNVDEYYLNNQLNGFSTSYYPNNKPSFVYRYDHSWLLGWEQYDSSGKLLSTANFPGGNGKYETKHFNGAVMVRSAYEAYQLHGLYETFYYNGQPRTSMKYRYGKAFDSVISRHINGSIESRGLMQNNEKQGTWQYYYEDGKLKETENHHSGNLHGENTYYRPDGSLEKMVTYKDGIFEGKTIFYNTSNELIIQLNYENGYAVSYTYTGKDGQPVPAISINPAKDSAVAFYKNGVKSAVFHFENQDEHGSRMQYHNNGALASSDQRHLGYINGIRKTYFSNGKLHKEESFYYGRFEGSSKEYYPSGKIKSDKTYVNDEPHGTWKFYNEAGAETETQVYFHGLLLSLQ